MGSISQILRGGERHRLRLRRRVYGIVVLEEGGEIEGFHGGALRRRCDHVGPGFYRYRCSCSHRACGEERELTPELEQDLQPLW